jgi:hypothetical protein
MTALFLGVLGLSLAAEPESAAPAAPTTPVSVETQAVAPTPTPPATPAFTVAATVEPLGSADDRVASRIELALREQADALRACLPLDLRGGPDDVWFLTAEITLSTTRGDVTRVVQRAGTGWNDTDACLLVALRALQTSPPPRYPDRDRVTIAFRVAATAGATPP